MIKIETIVKYEKKTLFFKGGGYKKKSELRGGRGFSWRGGRAPKNGGGIFRGGWNLK